jgi:hypothetical protein
LRIVSTKLANGARHPRSHPLNGVGHFDELGNFFHAPLQDGQQIGAPASYRFARLRDLLLRAKHLFVAVMVSLGCGMTWVNERGLET